MAYKNSRVSKSDFLRLWFPRQSNFLSACGFLKSLWQTKRKGGGGQERGLHIKVGIRAGITEV